MNEQNENNDLPQTLKDAGYKTVEFLQQKEEQPILPNSPIGSETSGQAGQVDNLQRISEQVAKSALPQINPRAGKRGRHPNNCDCEKCKLRRISPAGNSADTNFADQAEAATGSNEQSPEPFNEETIRPIAEGLADFLDEFGQGMIATLCTQKGKTEALTDKARAQAKMKPGIRRMIVQGGIGCARKYQTKFAYIEETAFIGGIAVHAGLLVMAFQSIKNDK